MTASDGEECSMMDEEVKGDTRRAVRTYLTEASYFFIVDMVTVMFDG